MYARVRASVLPTMPVTIMVMGNPTDTEPQPEVLEALPSCIAPEALALSIPPAAGCRSAW